MEGKTEPMENLENWTMENLLCRLSNLKFFCMMHIYKMVAILQFFHNGLCQYSVSIDTQKTGDPNIGGSIIWIFTVQCIFTKWWLFFDFFIMADINIPFLLTLRKLETQTLRGSVIWTFSIQYIFMKWWPFFYFFIMSNTNIPFLSKLRKLETQTLERG